MSKIKNNLHSNLKHYIYDINMLNILNIYLHKNMRNDIEKVYESFADNSLYKANIKTLKSYAYMIYKYNTKNIDSKIKEVEPILKKYFKVLNIVGLVKFIFASHILQYLNLV